MKRESMSFPLCLAAIVFASVISFAASMCLVEAFSIPCDLVQLILLCCISSGFAAVVMAMKHSKIITLCVYIIYILLLILYKDEVMNGGQTILFHITSEYARCFQVMVLGNPGGDVQPVLSALAFLVAWLSVWTICREGYTALVAIVCAPFYILALLVVDLAPNLWLVLLTGALLILILAGSVRTHSSNEGAKVIWYVSLPVIALFALLITLSPVGGYTRSAWSQSLQKIVEGEVKLEIFKKRGDEAVVGWSSELQQVDLGDLGPQRQTGTFALEYCSGTEIRYLRGVSLGIYEDNKWKSAPGFSGSDLLIRKADGTFLLQVRTGSKQDVLFAPYYPAQLPVSGVAVDDSYIHNVDGVKEYEMFYSSDGYYIVSPEYEDYVFDVYTQIPEDMAQQLSRILEQAGLEHASAEEICAYVRDLGEYTLEAQRVPEGADFVLHFLNQTRKGYCTHFASAAVMLLRSAGIPSRFVTGYAVSGAADQWNRVTQDQAHAWVEFYLTGNGWLPLDPTPAQYRQIAAQDQPEEKPEPDQPVEEKPEQKPEEETQEKPEAQPQKTHTRRKNPLLWLLVLPALLVLLILRRFAILYCRKVRLRRLPQNKKTLEIWNRLLRLCRAGKAEMLEEWICLAEKAKFSQHTITDEELNLLCDAVQEMKEKLRQLPMLRRLWHRAFLVLY